MRFLVSLGTSSAIPADSPSPGGRGLEGERFFATLRMTNRVAKQSLIYWIEEWDLVIIRYPGNLILADKARAFPGAVEVFLESPEQYLSE